MKIKKRAFQSLLYIYLLFCPVEAFATEIYQALYAKVLSIYDGDTITVVFKDAEGNDIKEKIRILELDTPEIKGKCSFEKKKAIQSRDRLVDLVSDYPVRIEFLKRDKYKRMLAHVYTHEGVNVAEQLIKENLGRPYAGGRRSWCD